MLTGFHWLAFDVEGQTGNQPPRGHKMNVMTYAHRLVRAMVERWQSLGQSIDYPATLRACLRVAHRRFKPA